MPILRKKQEFWLAKDRASRIYYDVRYQGPGYNITPFFAAIPENQGSIKGINGIEWCEGSKGKNNGAYGFKGSSEKDAIDKLKKFMVADYNQGVIKEKVIFIQNDNEAKKWHQGDDQKTRQVTFSYQLAVKVIRNEEEVKYFELNAAGFETSFEKKEKGHSIVPWTEAREASCQAILALFDQLQERVNSMVTKDSIGLLDRNPGLLLSANKE